MATIAESILNSTQANAPHKNKWRGNEFQIAPGAGGLSAILGAPVDFNMGGGGEASAGNHLDEAQQRLADQRQEYVDYFNSRPDFRTSYDLFLNNSKDVNYLNSQDGYSSSPGDWLRWHNDQTPGNQLPMQDVNWDLAAEVMMGQQPQQQSAAPSGVGMGGFINQLSPEQIQQLMQQLSGAQGLNRGY